MTLKTKRSENSDTYIPAPKYKGENLVFSNKLIQGSELHK